MELQNTVKEALNVLYHHPDDAVRVQADRWLQEFQRTLDAWQPSICTKNTWPTVIISEGPPEVRTQISIAVAALALHVPADDWGTRATGRPEAVEPKVMDSAATDHSSFMQMSAVGVVTSGEAMAIVCSAVRNRREVEKAQLPPPPPGVQGGP